MFIKYFGNKFLEKNYCKLLMNCTKHLKTKKQICDRCENGFLISYFLFYAQ